MAELTKKSKKVSTSQLLCMVDFLEKNPQALSMKFSQTFTRNHRKKLWEELSRILNADGLGPCKDVKMWQKVFSDQKCTIRAKAGRISQHRKGTGGGHETWEKLTEIEERILNLVGRVSAEGNEDVSEAGFSESSDAPPNFMETMRDFFGELSVPAIGATETVVTSGETVASTSCTSTKRSMDSTETVTSASSKRSKMSEQGEQISLKEKLEEQIIAMNEQTQVNRQLTEALKCLTEAINAQTEALNRLCARSNVHYV